MLRRCAFAATSRVRLRWRARRFVPAPRATRSAPASPAPSRGAPRTRTWSEKARRPRRVRGGSAPCMARTRRAARTGCTARNPPCVSAGCARAPSCRSRVRGSSSRASSRSAWSTACTDGAIRWGRCGTCVVRHRKAPRRAVPADRGRGGRRRARHRARDARPTRARFRPRRSPSAPSNRRSSG